MRAAALVVAAVGVAFALVTAQSVSVARTADIAAARQPLTPDAAAVRCFGVQCPVLPPMGSRGGVPLTQPQVQALSLSSAAEAQQPLQRLSAKPFLPPPGSPGDSVSTHHLQVQSDAQPQQPPQPQQPQQPAAASAQQPSSAFAEQLQKLQPQLQSAGQRVQQFGQSVGERMQSFGKTIAGLGGGTGGSGSDKTDAHAKAKADADTRASADTNPNAGGGVDSAQMPLNAQSQQQLMQPLQQPLQQPQPMAMPQSPLRDAKMEAALARGNLEPLTVVQPNANANGRGSIAAAPNTISAAGTGTRFVRDEQPALLDRNTAAAAESEGHGGGGGFGFGGGAIVAAVPTPVTNVLPAVAPVVPAIPIARPPPPPVAPVATLAAVPVAVPICPKGHCH